MYLHFLRRRIQNTFSRNYTFPPNLPDDNITILRKYKLPINLSDDNISLKKTSIHMKIPTSYAYLQFEIPLNGLWDTKSE